jgi:hypothetical protein
MFYLFPGCYLTWVSPALSGLPIVLQLLQDVSSLNLLVATQTRIQKRQEPQTLITVYPKLASVETALPQIQPQSELLLLLHCH